MLSVDNNTFFRDVTLRICGSLELEKALYQSFLYIRELLPADLMVLSYFDGNAGLQRHLAEATISGGKRLEFTTPLSPETLATVNARIKNGSLPMVEIFDRPETHPITRLASRHWGIPQGSLIIIRLILEGNFLGSFSLIAEGRDRYTRDHAALLDLLREPFAVALSNYVRYCEVLELKDLLSEENRYLQAELQRLNSTEIIGADFGLRSVMEMIRQVAPLTSPVMLLGANIQIV